MVFARYSFEDGSNAVTVVSVRCLFAVIAIALTLKFAPAQRPALGHERWLLLGMGVVFALNVFAFYKSIELLRVPLAVLIFYINPLLIGLLSGWVGLERHSTRTWMWACVSLVGLAFATGASPESIDPNGVLWAIAAAFMITVVLVLSTRFLTHIDARSRTGWMMASTTAILWLVSVSSGSLAWPQHAAGGWAIVAVSVLYAIGVVSLFTSATRIGPLRTAVVMNLEPLIAIAGSWMVLGQGLTPMQLFGGVLVLGGVLGAQLGRGVVTHPIKGEVHAARR